jgi:hypothetical protein
VRLVAALARRSWAGRGAALFAVLLLAAATPIDLLDLNDSAIGCPDEGPIVGDQLQILAVCQLHEMILDAAYHIVSSSSRGSIIPETTQIASNAVPKRLPTRRPWIRARAHIDHQDSGPSSPTSELSLGADCSMPAAPGILENTLQGGDARFLWCLVLDPDFIISPLHVYM